VPIPLFYRSVHGASPIRDTICPVSLCQVPCKEKYTTAVQPGVSGSTKYTWARFASHRKLATPFFPSSFFLTHPSFSFFLSAHRVLRLGRLAFGSSPALPFTSLLLLDAVRVEKKSENPFTFLSLSFLKRYFTLFASIFLLENLFPSSNPRAVSSRRSQRKTLFACLFPFFITSENLEILSPTPVTDAVHRHLLDFHNNRKYGRRSSNGQPVHQRLPARTPGERPSGSGSCCLHPSPSAQLPAQRGPR